MAKPQKQVEMFEQERIAEIETAIMKADKKRAEIDDYNETETDTLKNLENKVREAMHKHLTALDAQEDGKGNKRWVYNRGDYKAELKGLEKLSYDKVRKAAGNGEKKDDESSE